MGKPRILLLDEPSMGISPVLTERIYETIAEINQEGMTILLVEQNANFALDVSKRAYVLETGKVVMSDPANITDPREAGESPEIERSVVDLPAPLEPISVTHSPSSTVSETPFSAWMLP